MPGIDALKMRNLGSEETTARGDAIGVSGFSIVEFVYAAEKPLNPFTGNDLQIVIGALWAQRPHRSVRKSFPSTPRSGSG